MNDLLPDSRAKETKNRIFAKSGTWVPIFCANCGKHSGSCPEQNMTFMFYLCTPCFQIYGDLTNTMVVPDEVFNQKVIDEQMEKYGRMLESSEIEVILQENTAPLAKLLTGR